jgi:glucosamine kinase
MHLRLGIDGGGSKTECLLVDETGAVVARHTGPGCNPNLVGPERARAVLAEAIGALRAAAGAAPTAPFTVSLLCMAGSSAFWRETTAAFPELGAVTLRADALPVLELATSGGPGLAIHAGTGSFIVARGLDGVVHYAGGLGWRFGDAGSGYDIGRRGIGRALAELQGWAERSALADALTALTGLPEYAANSRFLYSAPDPAPMITGFAPRVVDLAADGCAPAQRVIAEALGELAGYVNAVLARLFPEATAAAPLPCGISGALLNREPCFYGLRALASVHAWPVRLESITDPPIEGVRRLLVRLA